MRLISFAATLLLGTTVAQSADAQSVTVANLIERTCWTYIVDGREDRAVANARAMGLTVVPQVDNVTTSQGAVASGHGYRIVMQFWRDQYTCTLTGPTSVSQPALEAALAGLARGWSSETDDDGRFWTSPDGGHWARVKQEGDGKLYFTVGSQDDSYW